jgi:hypothetical protein
VPITLYASRSYAAAPRASVRANEIALVRFASVDGQAGTPCIAAECSCWIDGEGCLGRLPKACEVKVLLHKGNG